jgi:hypothetical protein
MTLPVAPTVKRRPRTPVMAKAPPPRSLPKQILWRPLIKFSDRSTHIMNICCVQGSVIDYEHDRKDAAFSKLHDGPRPSQVITAIVNAANEGCICGGGVDGAISKAGKQLKSQEKKFLLQQPDVLFCAHQEANVCIETDSTCPQAKIVASV